jgi:Xaa-Pro aminopeptidase
MALYQGITRPLFQNHLLFSAAAGAGPNAGILHYERNTAIVGPEDLVLIDAGAEFRCYTADITRTFPAAGRFTAAQRDIYEAVLAVQQHALEHIRPGNMT